MHPQNESDLCEPNKIYENIFPPRPIVVKLEENQELGECLSATRRKDRLPTKMVIKH